MPCRAVRCGAVLCFAVFCFAVLCFAVLRCLLAVRLMRPAVQMHALLPAWGRNAGAAAGYACGLRELLSVGVQRSSPGMQEGVQAGCRERHLTINSTLGPAFSSCCLPAQPVLLSSTASIACLRSFTCRLPCTLHALRALQGARSSRRSCWRT